jgi:hypothetical protein
VLRDDVLHTIHKIISQKILARFTDGEVTNNSMLTKNKKSRWQHDVKVLPLYDV